jgi:glutathione S-transferase
MAETDVGVPNPSTVSVYGVDHSPWVQSVLLGLQERGIEYRTRTIPPLAVFLRSGILMPAASINGGLWMLDSEGILVALGFAEVPREVRRELTVAFTRCAAHRRDDMLEFWRRFGLVREEEPSWARRHWNFFWRAFAAFYFFCVLTVARRAVGRSTPEQSVQLFSALQKRLDPEAGFFGGERPDTVDLQLFGIVQMLGSIPGPPLSVLREDPALEPLRGWIARMQHRFENHPGLYSGPYFEPLLPAPETAGTSERIAFGCGAALMWLAFPLTLLTALFYFVCNRLRGL